MCLEPEDFEEWFERTQSLPTENLHRLDLYWRDNFETSVDQQLHSIVETVLAINIYFVSLKTTCFLTTGSYFLYSIFSGCKRLFLVIEYLYPVPAVLSIWIISLLLFPATTTIL